MRRPLRDRGATDPILVIAAIAVSLVLLVGGTFAVAGMLDNGRDLNARNDLDKVATAEQSAAAAGPATYHWDGDANRSTSTASTGGGTRRNLITNPNFSTGTTGWAPLNDATLTWSTSTYRARVTGSRTIDSGEPFIQTDALPGEVGQQVSARVRVTNLTSGNRPMRLQISAFSSTDGTGDSVGRSDLINTQVPAGAGADLLLDGYVLPAGTHSYRLKAVTSYTTITAGDVIELDNALVEAGQAVGPYFDGGTTPTTNAILPYLSDGTTGSLRYDLQPDGGTTPATWLARQGLGFTPSDGVRTAVLTTPAGDGWVAVSKSQTGKVFLRTSSAAAVSQLGGTTGSRTVPAAVRLPAGLNAADITAALANAGGF
ncbi:hypothetical protein ACWGJ9_08765 [Curtobacterium citreum]